MFFFFFGKGSLPGCFSWGNHFSSRFLGFYHSLRNSLISCKALNWNCILSALFYVCSVSAPCLIRLSKAWTGGWCEDDDHAANAGRDNSMYFASSFVKLLLNETGRVYVLNQSIPLEALLRDATFSCYIIVWYDVMSAWTLKVKIDLQFSNFYSFSRNSYTHSTYPESLLPLSHFFFSDCPYS